MSSSRTADEGGETSVISVHSDVIQSHILSRLDGTALVSTSCVSSQFLSLCKDDRLWRDICNSTWPSTTHWRVRDAICSFPCSHRSFFHDAFPSVCQDGPRRQGKTDSPSTAELISAVDVHYGETLEYSKVMETETLSGWFLSSPFRVELLHPKETVKFGGEKERLRVSWILIDPARKRAVNVASQRAVEARRHWLNDDVQLRFASVVGELVQCVVVATCSGTDVKEVTMQVEDMEGKILSGADSLEILQAAMAGERKRIESKMEKEIYEMHSRKKEQYRERKQRRETSLDLLFIAAGVTIFLAILDY